MLLSALQVNDVVFSSDERHFATCSEDGSVRVWTAPSNELVVQFQVLNQVREYQKISNQYVSQVQYESKEAFFLMDTLMEHLRLL